MDGIWSGQLYDPRDNNNVEIFVALCLSFPEAGNPGLFLLLITLPLICSVSGCSQKGHVQLCSKLYGGDSVMTQWEVGLRVSFIRHATLGSPSPKPCSPSSAVLQ